MFILRRKIFVFCTFFVWVLHVIICFSRFSRPSGSESDSDEEPHKPAGQPVAVRSSSYLTGTGNQPNVQHPAANNRGVRPHPLATQINSTPSPQLSLAEFLQDEWVTHLVLLILHAILITHFESKILPPLFFGFFYAAVCLQFSVHLWKTMIHENVGEKRRGQVCFSAKRTKTKEYLVHLIGKKNLLDV